MNWILHMIKWLSVSALWAMISGHANAQSHESFNGISYVAVNKKLDSSHVVPVAQVGANWASVIPFAYMPGPKLPQLLHNIKWQWRGERIVGIRESIQLLHEQGIKVMLKPQVWVGHHTYTGEIRMTSEKDWKKFESKYRDYIMDYAKMGHEEGVEMICIGTEMKIVAEKRPDFWRSLIQELRTFYTGKLTYASNWDDFDQVPFWESLDYIGIDAYCPITNIDHASIENLRSGWEKQWQPMEEVAKKYNKQIIFTEYGYRSIENCANRPWDYDKGGAVDHQAQCDALQALYDVVWPKEWFSGGFLWKWYPDHEQAGGPRNGMFTVQNKRSEKVVREHYSGSAQ